MQNSSIAHRVISGKKSEYKLNTRECRQDKNDSTGEYTKKKKIQIIINAL